MSCHERQRSKLFESNFYAIESHIVLGVNGNYVSQLSNHIALVSYPNQIGAFQSFLPPK